MKVAVCLSGQLRWVEECYKEINNKIIAPNNADVFIHSWYSDTLADKVFTEHGQNSLFYKGQLQKNADKLAVKLYKPLNSIFEEQKDFSDLSKNIDISPYSTPAINQFSMFYSIFKCNQLKKQHEIDNKFIYDAVIRCRFDLQPYQNFKAENFDLNVINAKSDCRHTSYCINDHFAISNSKNMDVYSDTYNYLIKYYSEDKEPFCPEILLGYGLRYDQTRKVDVKLHNFATSIKYVYR